MMKSLVMISCMASDFEKDKVFLTKRALDCFKVLYQRSIRLICRCLCRHNDEFLQERRVDKLPRSRCNFGNLCRRVGFAPKAYDWLLHFAPGYICASVRVHYVCRSLCTSIVGCHWHCARFSQCSSCYMLDKCK